MRRAVCVLTLAACNQVYGLDPTTVRSLEPPPCSTVQFSAPVVMREFEDNGTQEFDPQLSADGNELWLAFTPVSGGVVQLHRSLRKSDGTFGEPVLAEPIATNGRAFGDPSLTADGLRLMFLVDSPPPNIFEAVRTSPDQYPFELVLTVPGAPSTGAIDLSWDGLRLYYTDDGDLRMVSRPARNMPFEAPSEVLLQNVNYPTVSGDELEVFYVHSPANPSVVYRSSRTTPTGPFGGEQRILDFASDPDIAPNTTEMIVGYMNSLASMKRTCEED